MKNIILYYLALQTASVLIFAACKNELNIPTLTTSVVSQITDTSAFCGGTIISDGGSPIIARGVVCGDETDLLIEWNLHTHDGTGTGSFVSNIKYLAPDTKYYAKTYATNSTGTAYGNKVSFTTLPRPITWGVSAISSKSVILHGWAFPNSSSPLTVSFEYGPTTNYGGITSNQYFNIADETGSVIDAPLTGLTPGTKYHFRVKVVGTESITYGKDLTFTTFNDLTITDIDGNFYNTVTIGTQTWMAENLKVTRLNDGTYIPLVTNNALWNTLTTPAYCWYNNTDSINKNTYGALYNAYAVETGKLCPTGWHVPTYAELSKLVSEMGEQVWAGYKLTEFEYSGCNSSGFSARMGGERYDTGTFEWITESGYWWGYDITGFSEFWLRAGNTFAHGPFVWPESGKGYGKSVRCIKD